MVEVVAEEVNRNSVMNVDKKAILQASALLKLK
jgi:hypothetical protein